MKEKTIVDFINKLQELNDSGLNIKEYCKNNGLSRNYFYNKMSAIKNTVDNNTELYKKAASLYNAVKSDVEEEFPITIYNEENRAGITIIRDSENKIVRYQVNVAVKNKPNFRATLERDELECLFGLYTYYGGNITARNVSREFPRFTLAEVKKLFRAFGITKDSAWFPPHMLEESTEEELANYRINLKEKAAFKYADSRQERDFNNEIKKLASQINALNDRNDLLVKLAESASSLHPFVLESPKSPKNKMLMLHLSDFHIGAKVESGSLYENIWNDEELENRLMYIIEQVSKLGEFEELHINLLGDGIDGFNGFTARGGHILPQNMDNLEQIQSYLKYMEWFIRSIIQSCNYNKIYIHAVRNGNHPGDAEYLLNLVLKARLEAMFSKSVFKFEIFDTYFGHYKVDKYDYIICHGRDAKFHKAGMPLNLDPKNKVIIYDWLADKGITGNDIQVIKGDLHTENLNSSYRLTYRNVLSLFGSSDYSQMNFTRNQCGVSYEMIISNQLVRGTFDIK